MSSFSTDSLTQSATSVNPPTPLARLQAAFPALRQRRNGWWFHADAPRFDALETPEGNIRIHSWTGRDVDAILAMGDPAYPIKRGHLYAKPGQRSAVQSRDTLDLLTLADHMCLPWQFLEQEGYSDGYTYTWPSGESIQCVKVGGCFTPEGIENSKPQVRVALAGKKRFYYDQNAPGRPGPFGLHHLDLARLLGYLLIGEGSSDYATMRVHGLPFVGIPGASNVRSLEDVALLLAGIPAVYIIEEPDQAASLSRRGQGFYKSVRAHLREGGYTGAIFSIRFEEATGFKDPSDLHKALYHACKETEEAPFLADIHREFIEAIERAMTGALPEGNEATRPVIRDLAGMSFEDFYREVWAVPTAFLSPIQKGIVCYLFLYMREATPDPEGWRIDASELAPRMGFTGKKGAVKFLEHLSYLHQKLGIVEKQHRARKEYGNGPEGNERVVYRGMDLYIAPAPSFFTPRGYCVTVADQHQPGGPRIPTEECTLCGSRHLRHYARQCVDCGHVMYPAIQEDDDDDAADYEERRADRRAILYARREAEAVESTLAPEPVCVFAGDAPLESVPVSEHPKMGRPEIESNTIPQNGATGDASDVEPIAPDPASAPQGMTPGTLPWNRLVERDGLARTVENARAWYERTGRAIPTGLQWAPLLE